MSIYHTIKHALHSNLEVVYKKLSIGPVEIDNEKYIQVHCDRHDINHSCLFTLDKMNRAISKFLELEKEYKESEKRHGCKYDNFFNWT